MRGKNELKKLLNEYQRWLYGKTSPFYVPGKHPRYPRSWGIIDRLNYGNNKCFIHGKNEYEYYLNSSHDKLFTRKYLERHLNAKCSDYFYYTSSRHSGYMLLMIDIDGDDERQDAADVAKWIKDVYHPQMYTEPSTSHYGWHGYLVCKLEYHGKSIPHWFISKDNVLGKYTNALKDAVINEGFQAAVDTVNGGYSNIKWNDSINRWECVNRGKLSLLPYLPQGLSDLEQLKNSTITLDDINQTINSIVSSESVSMTNKKVDAVASPQTELTEPQERNNIYTSKFTCGTVYGSGLKMMMESDNAWERSRGCLFDLTNRINAVPEFKEYKAHYYSMGLNTGPENRCSSDRLHQIWEYEKDRLKPFSASRGFNEEDYEFVRLSKQDMEHLRHEKIINQNKKPIREEFVQVVVWLAECPIMNDPLWHFTLGRERITAATTVLRKTGVLKSKYSHPSQIANAIRIACHYEWIECIDEGFVVGKGSTAGVSRRYIPGPKHPRRDVFLKKYSDLVEKARNSTAMEKQLIKKLN